MPNPCIQAPGLASLVRYHGLVRWWLALTTPGEPTKRVLLVEDNPADARLVEEVLGEVCPHAGLHVVSDAGQALRHVERVIASQEPRPHLILLDINLPGLPGTEVLGAIRAHEALAALPVVVLTSTSAPAELDRLGKLGADSVATKPLGVDAFYGLIEGLCRRWLIEDPPVAGAGDSA